MSARDDFSVYLRGMDARHVDLRVLDDGRRWLDITSDVSLVVRPDDDGLAASVAGLRKLAAAALQMADSLVPAVGEPKGGAR